MAAPFRLSPPWPLPASLVAVLIAILLSAPMARAAWPLSAASLCGAAIALTEPDSQLPPRLLSAIALVESGRADPGTGTAIPWPWTIDIGGVGRAFETEAAAIAAVRAAQDAGTRSIDVGCMQINLLHHPHAFATLEEAFDPASNVRYAARFLRALHSQTGDWAAAIASYHSAIPERGTPYAHRVAAAWPLAVRFGLSPDAAALEVEVDPHHVLTPQFRAEMIQAAAFRHRQGTPPHAAPSTAKALTTATLEAEVDPKHVLTPAFRAQLMAAAAFRHRQEAKLRADPAIVASRVAAPASVSTIALAW